MYHAVTISAPDTPRCPTPRLPCASAAAQVQGGHEEKSHRAASGGGGSPGPLEVEATEVAGDIDHFSDEIEAGDGAALHGLRGECGGAYAAGGDFGLLVALGAGGRESETVQAAFQSVQGAVGLRPWGAATPANRSASRAGRCMRSAALSEARSRRACLRP